MATKDGERFLEKAVRCTHHQTIAFSLVEIALAIGIASFVVLSIFGLLSVGMLSSRESQEDTILALATQQVAAWSRSQPYADLRAAAQADPRKPILLFLNAEGVLAWKQDGSPAANPISDSHYLCKVQPLPSGISGNLVYLQYSFEWPLAAPESKRQKHVVLASRSNGN